MSRPITLSPVWNKDLTITLYARGKKVHRTSKRVGDPKEEMKWFCKGWFDTEDESQWKIGKWWFTK